VKPVRRRLDIRVPPGVRKLLEAAARASGESLTVFMMRAALDRAREHAEPDILQAACDEVDRVQFKFGR
jgi:uncharacterized protein (DUF1778 family)